MVKTLNQKKYKAYTPQQSCLSKSSFELKGLCWSLVSSILMIPTAFSVFFVFLSATIILECNSNNSVVFHNL